MNGESLLIRPFLHTPISKVYWSTCVVQSRWAKCCGGTAPREQKLGDLVSPPQRVFENFGWCGTPLRNETTFGSGAKVGHWALNGRCQSGYRLRLTKATTGKSAHIAARAGCCIPPKFLGGWENECLEGKWRKSKLSMKLRKVYNSLKWLCLTVWLFWAGTCTHLCAMFQTTPEMDRHSTTLSDFQGVCGKFRWDVIHLQAGPSNIKRPPCRWTCWWQWTLAQFCERLNVCFCSWTDERPRHDHSNSLLHVR